MCGALVSMLALMPGCTSGGKSATGTSINREARVSGAVTPSGLPLGDGQYATTARKGSVFSCITSFNGQGAFHDGPWIDSAAKTWDSTKKIAVQGATTHSDARFASSLTETTQRLTGNGLPSTPTGTFPVSSSDPAFQYDRNPNSVQSYPLDVSLPAAPVVNSSPTCVGGTIGVSVLGVPIYSAFDALGRDAAAHEVQDSCGGHPEITGQYHFHALSPCFKGAAAGFDDGLFGYALDGFGIYVEKDASGNGLTSAALDECHGRTSEITWYGKKTAMYHYVATIDFPYLVACYRGTPISSATGLRIR